MAISREEADRLVTQAYEEYYSSLLALCKNRLRDCRDYADDCVQKTFMFYFDKLLEGEEIINTKAYLYKVANMTCKAEYTSYIRREMKTAELDTATEVADPVQDFDLAHAADIDYDAVAALLLAELSAEEQRLYALKYVERKPLDEIGEILGMKPNTVAQRVTRLRNKIKELVVPALESYGKGG